MHGTGSGQRIKADAVVSYRRLGWGSFGVVLLRCATGSTDTRDQWRLDRRPDSLGPVSRVFHSRGGGVPGVRILVGILETEEGM